MAKGEPVMQTLGERLLARYDRLPGRVLSREERGYTWPAELDNQQHPDWPEGFTYARVFRELHGRTHIFTVEQRQALADRIAGIRERGERSVTVTAEKTITPAVEITTLQLAIVDQAYDAAVKRTKAEYMREYNARPEVKARYREYYAANRERKAEYMRAYQQRPEVKERQREWANAYQQRPEVKAQRNAKRRAHYQRTGK